MKLEGGVPSGKLKTPPNNCIPRRAKMRMNRKRRNSKDMMERMELKREITRFLKEDQYLVTLSEVKSNPGPGIIGVKIYVPNPNQCWSGDQSANF